MKHEFKKTCVQYIFGLAWSDGHFDPVEREFLSTMVDRADLPQEQYMEVIQWLEEPPPEPNWAILTQQPKIAQDVLRQAMLLAMLDMSVSVEESAFLERLKEQIGMTQAEFWAIQADVEKIIAAQIKG